MTEPTPRDHFRNRAQMRGDEFRQTRCKAHDVHFCEICGPVCRHGMPLIDMHGCVGCVARAEAMKLHHGPTRIGTYMPGTREYVCEVS